jgi:hypothetical protein
MESIIQTKNSEGIFLPNFDALQGKKPRILAF